MGHSQLSVICTCGSTLALGWVDRWIEGWPGRRATHKPSNTFLKFFSHACINTGASQTYDKSGVPKLVPVTCCTENKSVARGERKSSLLYKLTCRFCTCVSVNDPCVCVCVPPPSYCVPILSKRQKAHLDLVGWKVGLLHRALLVN